MRQPVILANRSSGELYKMEGFHGKGERHKEVTSRVDLVSGKVAFQGHKGPIRKFTQPGDSQLPGGACVPGRG